MKKWLKLIKYRMKQSQDIIEYHRKQISELKRELSFMLGHYDKIWEEEFEKMKTKEICENCGKREWWHNPSNIHNSCKKFKAQEDELDKFIVERVEPQNNQKTDEEEKAEKNWKDGWKFGYERAVLDMKITKLKHSPQKRKTPEDKEPEVCETHNSISSGSDESLSENRKELKKVLQNTRNDLIKEINYIFGLIEEQDKEFIKNFDNIEVEGLDETCKRLMIREIKQRAGKGLSNG